MLLIQSQSGDREEREDGGKQDKFPPESGNPEKLPAQLGLERRVGIEHREAERRAVRTEGTGLASSGHSAQGASFSP